MMKILISAAVGLMMVWAGSAVISSASAGGGAPFVVTKQKPPLAESAQNRTRGTRGTEITEFSSSSARRHQPNR